MPVQCSLQMRVPGAPPSHPGYDVVIGNSLSSLMWSYFGLPAPYFPVSLGGNNDVVCVNTYVPCSVLTRSINSTDRSRLRRPFFGLPQAAHGDTFSRFVTWTTSLVKPNFIQVSQAMPNNPSLCDIGSGGPARPETFLSPIVQRIQAKTLCSKTETQLCAAKLRVAQIHTLLSHSFWSIYGVHLHHRDIPPLPPPKILLCNTRVLVCRIPLTRITPMHAYASLVPRLSATITK